MSRLTVLYKYLGLRSHSMWKPERQNKKRKRKMGGKREGRMGEKIESEGGGVMRAKAKTFLRTNCPNKLLSFQVKNYGEIKATVNDI